MATQSIPYPVPHPPSAQNNTEVARLKKATSQELEIHYHKGLSHQADGQVKKGDFETLRKALDIHKPSLFKGIALGSGKESRRLVNPQAGLAADRQSAFAWHYELPKAPEHADQFSTTAAEMLEVYWMAKLRHVPFDEWDGDSGVNAAVKELKKYPLYPKLSNPAEPTDATEPSYEAWGDLDTGTLFRGGDWQRGESPAEHLGPMISQFLWLKVPYGVQEFDQRERRRIPSDEIKGGNLPHMTRWQDWLDVQNGKDVEDKSVDADEGVGFVPEYLHDMAGMARYVHLDKLYQAYLNAGFILIGAGVKSGPGNPYGKTPSSSAEFPHEAGFGTFDVPHVLSLVTEVATRALKAVWYQKWIGNLRMRPEAYGGLVHRAFLTEDFDGSELINDKSVASAREALGEDALAILEESLDSGILGLLKGKTYDAGDGAKYQSLLLPMSFKEGSPIHPSYGAGHATVAGACVTILKAFFDEETKFVDLENSKYRPQKPGKDKDGKFTELEGLSDSEDAEKLTVGGELDKLAANIAIGRNMAGVHWRTDYSQSLLLGQRVAISMLFHQRKDYHERPWHFEFTTFRGNKVWIGYDHGKKDGVYLNGVQILGASHDNNSEGEAEALNEIS